MTNAPSRYFKRTRQLSTTDGKTDAANDTMIIDTWALNS